MKKKALIFIVVLFLLFCSSISIFGWITYQKRTKGIDASSEGVTYIYKINGEEYNNSKKINIYNLSFFDIDEENELKYFPDMAYKIKIEIENTTSSTVNCLVNQIDEIDFNSPYIYCLFSRTEITDESILNYSKISDLISDDNSINQEIKTRESITLYAYIFGVQPIVSADNSFLNDTYSFTISISASNIK